MYPDLELLRKSIAETSVNSLFLERNMDRVLLHLMDYLNPVRQAITRKPGSGTGYQGYIRTPGITTNTFDDVLDLDDITDPNEKTGTYTELNLPYKTIGSKGRIYRRVQKTGRSVADLFREEVEGKAAELRDAEEMRIYWGNSPTANTLQFPGLNSYMVTNATSQVVALTNTGVGVTLTLAKLDEAIDANRGNPGLIVTSRAGRRKLNALLVANQRFIGSTEIAGGFRVMTYNDIPVVASTNIPDSLNITSGGTVSALTGGSTTCMFIVDTDPGVLWMDVLTEVFMKLLAETSPQWQEFAMLQDQTLVLKDYRKVSQLTGIAILGT